MELYVCTEPLIFCGNGDDVVMSTITAMKHAFVGGFSHENNLSCSPVRMYHYVCVHTHVLRRFVPPLRAVVALSTSDAMHDAYPVLPNIACM